MKKINTLLEHDKIKFGDYILFQEYKYDSNSKSYNVSKPIFVIFLGYFIADQALGFNYVEWLNENHTEYINNENVTNLKVCKEVKEINCHIEWDDYIDILGHWKNKPNWKEIISKYRLMNSNDIEDDIITNLE
ncbi:hypothetical protein M0Q50_01855 [bacterium]|jgi:hypothetical protein|nr:hypothetical protein [bacterium]